MNNKVFYGRKSTSRQDTSEALQLDEVEKKFGKMDVYFFDDGVSGDAKLEKKVQLLECLEYLTKGDTLHVYSLSRLSRDMLQSLLIEREITVKGANLMSVRESEQMGDSPEKTLCRTILNAVSCYEKEMIRARTKASRATLRKQNKYLGGKRQYGWKVVGKELVEVPNEQETIVKIKGWRAAGLRTQAICDNLNSSGIESATGTSWNYSSVRKLVNRI